MAADSGAPAQTSVNEDNLQTGRSRRRGTDAIYIGALSGNIAWRTARFARRIAKCYGVNRPGKGCLSDALAAATNEAKKSKESKESKESQLGFATVSKFEHETEKVSSAL